MLAPTGDGRPARPATRAEQARGPVGGALRLAVAPVALDDGRPALVPTSFVAEGPVRSGGQGEVIAVRDAGDPQRRYALKLFDGRSAALREWAALQAHRNERAVPLGYAIGRVSTQGRAEGARAAGERWGVVMELVEGRALDEALVDGAFARSLTVERVLEIMAPVVRFCTSAETSRAPHVHRDIKPSNIMVDSEGGVRIIDFGIAAREPRPGRGDAEEEGPWADAGGAGTPGFTAPEVLAAPQEDREGAGASAAGGCGGERPGSADPRVDTYGIAATAAFLLAGPAAWQPGPASAEGAAESQGAGPAAAAPPSAPGVVGVPVALPHDQHLVDDLRRRVQDDLARKLGEPTAARACDQAVRVALAEMDAKVALRLGECLSPVQHERPFPSQLESLLPLNREHYESELFSHAVIAALSRQAEAAAPPALADGAPSSRADGSGAAALPAFADELAADRSFADALAAFNSGCYAQALPILRKRADEGDLSAMYYLGVCIRDKCGPLRPGEGWAHVEHYFSAAAEAGNVLAQNAYGQLLYEGRHVRGNPEEGLRLIRQAAEDVPSRGKSGLRAAKEWLSARGL